MYKGQMEKTKGGQDQGLEVGMPGIGAGGGAENMETIVLEQQKMWKNKK